MWKWNKSELEQGTEEQVSGAPSFSQSRAFVFFVMFSSRGRKMTTTPPKISLFRVAHFGEVRSRGIFHLFFPIFEGMLKKSPISLFAALFFSGRDGNECRNSHWTGFLFAFAWTLGRNVCRNGLVRVKTRGGEIVPKNWGFDKWYWTYISVKTILYSSPQLCTSK